MNTAQCFFFSEIRACLFFFSLSVPPKTVLDFYFFFETGHISLFFVVFLFRKESLRFFIRIISTGNNLKILGTLKELKSTILNRSD